MKKIIILIIGLVFLTGCSSNHSSSKKAKFEGQYESITKKGTYKESKLFIYDKEGDADAMITFKDSNSGVIATIDREGQRIAFPDFSESDGYKYEMLNSGNISIYFDEGKVEFKRIGDLKK
ncbi:hypothetical protein [Streptococcus pluranimalium]|uniref:hypothetical protein n=1 Tax=Streptococcus pluranimalium TaxID=82348 RepID=UPI003F66CCA2